MATYAAFRALRLVKESPIITRSCKKLELWNCLEFYDQRRTAGHAKWQNIASTKRSNDLQKGKTISRYVLMVRRAVIANNRQADPKLNSKLADVLAEAAKMNVPKATLDRAIARAVDVKVFTRNLEIQGPGGCAMIAQCETDNVALLRRDLKKILKKFDGVFVPDDSMIGMFQSRGYIRAATKTKDLRDIDADYAEEAAIVANAEDVSLETNPSATDADLATCWIFTTDANNLGPCKGELEKLGLRILSHDLNLVPYREVDFGQETFERVLELIAQLQEHDQVVEIYHNLRRPESNDK